MVVPRMVSKRGGRGPAATGGRDGDATPRPLAGRRALLVGALALVLAVAFPLLLATGRYTSDQLMTYYALIVVALLCHFADWRDGALPPARGGIVADSSARPRLGWPPARAEEKPLGALPFSATSLMRGLVFFLTLTFLLLGAVELLGGLSGQSGTTTGGTHLTPADQAIGGGLLVLGSGLALLVEFTGTSRIPGLQHLREDRPISWFAVLVVTIAFAQLLSPTSGTASVASAIATTTTAADLITGSLPFGIIALLAVGPLVARSPREAALRLALVPVRPAWLLVGVAVGILLVPAVDGIFTPLQNHLLPQDCILQQTQVQQSLAGGDSGRGWVANVAIALAAGVDEELLFRGVLLPRFGLLLSSLLFGAFHLQYTCHGLPAVGDLEIVALGVAFGLVRIGGGLTAAILTHAAYDGSILLNRIVPTPSAAVSVILAAALAGGLVALIRRRPATEESAARDAPRDTS